MSKVKAKDLRNMSSIELNQKKAALNKELFELRQKKVTGQLEKPHLFKVARRQVAQINTLLKEGQNAK